jgi:hypothetical protein
LASLADGHNIRPDLLVQEGLNIDGFQRAGVYVALDQVAAHFGQHIELIFGLHSFDDALERQIARQRADRPDGLLTGLAVDETDKIKV